MRLNLFILGILSFLFIQSSLIPNKTVEEKIYISLPAAEISYKKPDQLLEAIIYVESRGNDSIMGDQGKAVGCLQIWEIMVRQVNQDLKLLGSDKHFTYNDRWNCEKSKEMFNIWRDYHHSKSSYEKIARNWNGGPNGHKKLTTIKYWNRVKRYLDEINN